MNLMTGSGVYSSDGIAFVDERCAGVALTARPPVAHSREKRGRSSRMRRVLFVCTGNTCRSPIAAGIFNNLLREKHIRNVVAESAGTMAMDGMSVSPLAAIIAGRHGVNVRRHRARALTKELVDRADLVLTMTGQQWYEVTEFAPREKVAILSKFGTPGKAGRDISDPHGGTQETYEEIFDQLHTEIDRSFPMVLEWLSKNGGRAG